VHTAKPLENGKIGGLRTPKSMKRLTKFSIGD